MGVWRGPTLKQTEIVERLQAEHAMLLSSKAQLAESTASTFEEWWDENGIDYVPAGELGRPTAKELAQAGWQARGASEYERGPAEMYLCEINHLILHSDQPYIFRKHPDCYGCNKYLAHGTPAEHNPARAPHNKFASLWCDACPRPTSGRPAPQDAAMKVAWQADKIMDLCDEHADEGQIQAARFTLERLLENWHMERNSPATPPPADETLPAGAPQFYLRCPTCRARKGTRYENCLTCDSEGFVRVPSEDVLDALAAQPSGAQAAAQAAAPTTTNVREAFEKWYAAYKDITLYIDGMQDAFEAGYNARSKERDAQAAALGPKCSHGVLMREFCQRCEDGGTPASGTEGRGK